MLPARFSRSSCSMLLLSLIVLGLLLAGCWSSKLTLIKQEDAKVDRALVGNWDAVNPRGESATLIIRNLDDKRDYIEMKDSAKQYPQGVSRYIAFAAAVKDATFAHVKDLRDDGGVPDEWLLMRFDLAGGKLTIRQLKEEYMKGKSITSAEQLRQVLEQNLDDSAMYDGNETITAKRMVEN